MELVADALKARRVRPGRAHLKRDGQRLERLRRLQQRPALGLPGAERRAWVGASAWSSASSVQMDQHVDGGRLRVGRLGVSRATGRTDRRGGKEREREPGRSYHPLERTRVRAVATTTSMRITGGTLRSRAVRAPRGQATRPTSDRVREALASASWNRRGSCGGRACSTSMPARGPWRSRPFRAERRGPSSSSPRAKRRRSRGNVASLDLADVARILAVDVREAVRRLAGEARSDLVLLPPPPWALVDTGGGSACSPTSRAHAPRRGRARRPRARFAHALSPREGLAGSSRGVTATRHSPSTKPAILGRPASRTRGFLRMSPKSSLPPAGVPQSGGSTKYALVAVVLLLGWEASSRGEA